MTLDNILSAQKPDIELGLKSYLKTKVSVVIPAYNEEKSLPVLLAELNKLDAVNEIIIVDDGSTDNTGRIAEYLGATVIKHPYRKGNGASVKTGIRNANSDVVVLMDADLQHNPKEIPNLLAFIAEYDMVVGARIVNRHGSFHRNIANKFYNKFASYLTKFAILDLTSGFRAVRKNIAMKFLYLLPNRFSYPTTMTLALLRAGHSIKYVPIQANKRTGQSKISILDDGFKFVLIILKIIVLFSPLRVFLPMSLGFLGIGIAYYGYTFFTRHQFSIASVLFLITGVLLFMLGLISEQIAMLRMDRSEETAS